MITGSLLDPKIYILNQQRVLVFVGSLLRPYIYYEYIINFNDDSILLYSKIGFFIYSLSNLKL
jgi:hypothetical protein